MISLPKKLLDLFIVICLITGSAFTGGSKDEELNKIKKNIVGGLLNGELSPFSGSDIKEAEKIIALIEYDDDGTCFFSDIDYTCEDRAGWVEMKHLSRTVRLAILYRNETDAAKKDEYRKYILSLVDNWLNNDYQCSNWWYTKLAVPNAIGETALLMEGELSSRQFLLMSEIVGRGCFSVNSSMKTHAAANIIDLAMSSIKFGVMTGSKTAVKTAVKLVSEALEYSDEQGLRRDGTFFQHGNRLYMGGYGFTFINGMTVLLTMLTGTKYNFNPVQLSNMAGFIVDGLQTMSFGNILDPTTMGRSTSRNNSQPLKGVTGTLRKLASLEDMPRKDEILKYAESIENNTKTDTGVHYFDEAKFVVINNEDFYFSFRGGADDILYSEIINSENVLSYNSSFPGVTTIMHTGNEYINVSPVYDFCMIPGTTAARETDEELFAHEDYTYRYLKGTYGDAVADGAVVSFAKTEHEGIKMTVACFATDNAAFLLGAGFSDSGNRPLITTIDQTVSAGSFAAEGNTVTANGIRYTLIEGGTLKAENKHCVGNWHRNNLSYSDAAVEKDMFSVYFENSGSYAYSVMSEDTDESIQVIRNTEDIQAVELPDGRIAAVFYTDGSFEFGGTTYSGTAGNAYVY